MQLVRSVLLAAAALYECVAADFTITSTAAAAPEQALGELEPYAATWTVAGEAPLAALHVRTLGRVFIEYDASLAAADNTTLARVVISGNDTRLLNAFEVVPVEHDDAAVELHMTNTDFEGQGYLLTRVYVAHAQALGSLSVAWGSDAVVGDDVLVTANATGALALALAGSGDLYLGSASASWSVGSLAASVAGSGDIQLLAKSLEAEDVSINVAGSGDVAVVADAVKVQKSLSTAVAGSGDVMVQAGDLQVYNLSTAIAGSGDVTYSKKGACQQQSIALAGSGDIAAGSIVCENTDVSLVGSGDVLVQTTGNLTVSSIFGSEVRYYGAEPRSISVSGLFSFRGSHKNTKKIVKEAKRNDYDEVDVESPPEAAPVYVVVKTSSSFFSNEPKIRYDLEIEEYDAQVVDEFLASQDGTIRADYTSASVNNFAMVHASAHGSGGPAMVVVVGAALVAVAVAAAKYQRRRERQQYQPLV